MAVDIWNLAIRSAMIWDYLLIKNSSKKWPIYSGYSFLSMASKMNSTNMYLFIFPLFNLKKLTYQSIWGICYLKKNHGSRYLDLSWRFFSLNSNHVLHWNKNENIINCLNTDWLESDRLLSSYSAPISAVFPIVRFAGDPKPH